jgi:hypothetical protein
MRELLTYLENMPISDVAWWLQIVFMVSVALLVICVLGLVMSLRRHR